MISEDEINRERQKEREETYRNWNRLWKLENYAQDRRHKKEYNNEHHPQCERTDITYLYGIWWGCRKWTKSAQLTGRQMSEGGWAKDMHNRKRKYFAIAACGGVAVNTFTSLKSDDNEISPEIICKANWRRSGHLLCIISQIMEQSRQRCQLIALQRGWERGKLSGKWHGKYFWRMPCQFGK